MIKVALVRGKYMNPFETQNYRFEGEIEMRGISSFWPIGRPPFPLIRLFSPADILDYSPLRYFANRTVGDLQVLMGLGRYAQQFDIFHSADPHYFYSFQLALLRRRGLIRKLLLTSWETIPHNNEGTYAKRFIKRFSLIHADHILTYSRKAKAALVTEGIAPKKIATIPLGVDTYRFQPGRKKKHEGKTILFVGRLVDEKGAPDVYEAFKKLSKKRGNVRLVMLGEGRLAARIQKQAAIDNLLSKIAVKKVAYDNLHSYYELADIAVFPSRVTATWEEQYGMVILEAMSSGLPLITTRTGAIPELTDGVASFVPQANPASLCQAMDKLLSDENLSRKIGTMGRRRAIEKFDSRLFASKLLKLYLSL